MQDFRITRIGEDIYHILDSGNSSFYVVEGTERAAVIDTGITPGGKILPVVRSLTQKPLLLVVTHAHIDHFHHMDEFETVYMSHREFQMPEDFLIGMMAGKNLALHDTIDVNTNDVIDLGGNVLEICEVPGHTPGSIVVLEHKGQHLFTGDAIGSGMGVWMQVPGAISLEKYYVSLVNLLKWLIARGGRMKFYGGHNYQIFQSTLIPGYNPLNMGLLCDLIDLVDQVVHGTIVGRVSNVDKILTPNPALYASFGRAELQYSPDNIR